MRAVHLRVGFLRLLLGLAMASGIGIGGSARAQFDDEFESEFDGGAEAQPEESSEVSETGAESGDAFDEFDEEYPDEQPAEEADVDPEDALAARQFRTFNTYNGATGGLHTVDARGGQVGTFRLQLATDFFLSSGFIDESDEAERVGGSLSLGWTVHDNVEIWGSLQSYANSNTNSDPELFQVLGDIQLGVKGFYQVNDIFSVGGDLSIDLFNTVGDIGVVFKSTSIGIRANATADLRGMEQEIPLIARFNLQYYIDNSANLVEDVEQSRYNSLDDPSVMAEETRHLVTTVERFALNINRHDRLNLSLGFEAPLRVAEDFFIHPLLEWNWGIGLNRQGYTCVEPVAGVPETDGCAAVEGIGANPMDLTLGARIAPPVKGLSFLLAADIGLTGTSTFVRELSPNSPYNIYIGMAYAYDPTPPEPLEPEVREVERRVEVQLPPPLTGRVRGQIRGAGGSGLEGATIAFEGTELTALVSGSGGNFTSYALEPGEVRMRITHPEYRPGGCVANIPDERPEEGDLFVDVRCSLEALPARGIVAGRVIDDNGSGVAGARIMLSGASNQAVNAGTDGAFRIEDLTPGAYQVRVESDAHLISVSQLQVEAQGTAEPEIHVVARPRRPLVRVSGRNISLRRKVNFSNRGSDILPSSIPVLTELADHMMRNPDIQLVEIQAHTDNSGPRGRNMQLSQSRADAIRQWLIDHGVAGTRLQARGFGPDQPLVPNITPSNRARNRRVGFVIKQRAN